MTRDEIIRMAREAGLIPDSPYLVPHDNQMSGIERFAALVAAAEREACKAVCREVAERYPTDVWPENGESLDCKSARMARITAANIECEINERSTPG